MSLRIFPNLDPRIVLIRAPVTEITMQNLHDQIRSWEDEPGSMSYEPLIQSAGKEDLGGGVSVGITSTLQNCKVAFDMRATSRCSGSVTTASSDGSRLIDSSATFETDNVQAGDAVVNLTDESIATVLSVVGQNELVVLPLVTGTDNQFEISDNYKIWPNTQCEASGGNLVAVDGNGDTASAILPTTFIQVVRTASSSATTADLEAIQYSSYQNSVWIDTDSSNSGTDYPTGTREYPVNNLSDAVSIANEKGFSTLQLLNDITLDSGTDIEYFTVRGQSKINTAVTINTNALTTGITIQNCRVTGVLDGGTTIRRCLVHDLAYVNGNVFDSELYGTVYVDGGADAGFYRCSMHDINDQPVVDMGGTGQNCVFADWSGNLTFQNMTGADDINIQIDGGKITLDSTITAGTIEIDGIGRIVDNSTGTIVITDGLISRETITRANWNKVYIDTVSGSSGTAFPLGTPGYPVDSISDAKTIADGVNINSFNVLGSITLNTDYSGYFFCSSSPDNGTINLNGQDIDTATFKSITLTGNPGSGHFDAKDCIIPSGMTGIVAHLENCIMTGTFTITAGETLNMDRCTSPSSTTIDFNGTGSLGCANFSGVLAFANMTDAGSTIGLTGYYTLTIASSCTAGTLLMAGIGTVSDSGSITTVVDKTVPATVWDQLMSSHQVPGSIGANQQHGVVSLE